MMFQTFQNQMFFKDKFVPFELSSITTKTWGYNKKFKGNKVDCAAIWASGQSPEEACPETMLQSWKKSKTKIESILKSYVKVGINPSDINLKLAVPESILKNYFCSLDKITEYVFLSYEKPLNYDFMFDLHWLVAEIAEQHLNFDLSLIQRKRFNTYFKRVGDNIKLGKTKVKYNPYGSVTGRFGLKQGSFPIMNLPKEARSSIIPNNDAFIELDFNGAELRTFLHLAGEDQPEGDLHQWISDTIFKGELNREKTKQKVFSWLYDPNKNEEELEKVFKRGEVLQKHFDGCFVSTPFGRKIKSDDYHALNYLIQSTSSDLFLRQVIKIFKMLDGKKSKIAFTIHDSVVLDFAKEDQNLLKDLIQAFKETNFGIFKVNISGGKNFGEMKNIPL